MIGGVTRHMLIHLPGVPHLHVNRSLEILAGRVEAYREWETAKQPYLHPTLSRGSSGSVLWCQKMELSQGP